MRYMAKPIISNILLFIEALLLFLLTILFSLKITILNKNYIIKTLEKTNYYEYVYDEAKNTMSYITKKTGFSSKILENTFELENVKNDINLFVKSFYKGEKVVLNVEHLKENINNNLERYIEEKGLEVEEEKITNYTNKMVLTYKNEIKLLNNFTDLSNTINKLNKISTILIPLFILDLIVLIIINKKIFNKKEHNVLFYTSVISLIGTNIFINTLNINNLFIYNNKISEIIIGIIKNIQIKNFIFIILYIILGLLLTKRTKETE